MACISRGLICALVITITSCTKRAPMEGQLGASSKDELLERFNEAYRAEDLARLRPLFESYIITSVERKAYEDNFDRLLRLKARRVYLAAPHESDRRNHCIAYWISVEDRTRIYKSGFGERQGFAGFLGDVVGRLIFVLGDGSEVDPGLVVRNQGRFFSIGDDEYVTRDVLQDHENGRSSWRYVTADEMSKLEAEEAERSRTVPVLSNNSNEPKSR